jgi:hypothetical protein
MISATELFLMLFTDHEFHICCYVGATIGFFLCLYQFTDRLMILFSPGEQGAAAVVSCH